MSGDERSKDLIEQKPPATSPDPNRSPSAEDALAAQARQRTAPRTSATAHAARRGKLNARVSASAAAIPTNPLYTHTEALINGITGDFAFPTAGYEFDTGRLLFEFTDAQRTFYDTLYYPANPMPSPPALFADRFPCLATRPFGESEFDVALFALDPTHQLADIPLGIITAPIGYGKSTLLQYVLLYLRSLDPALVNATYPLILDCHRHKNRLESLHDDPAALEAHILHEEVIPWLRRVSQTFTRTRDDEFWTWYKRNVCGDLAVREDDVESTTPRGARRAAKRAALRSSERDRTDFPFAAAQYLVNEKGKVLVIAIDNADPLPTRVKIL